jgi:hypothetical protein
MLLHLAPRYCLALELSGSHTPLSLIVAIPLLLLRSTEFILYPSSFHFLSRYLKCSIHNLLLPRSRLDSRSRTHKIGSENPYFLPSGLQRSSYLKLGLVMAKKIFYIMSVAMGSAA